MTELFLKIIIMFSWDPHSLIKRLFSKKKKKKKTEENACKNEKTEKKKKKLCILCILSFKFPSLYTIIVYTTFAGEEC